MTDPSRVVEIEASTGKLLGLCTLGILMTAAAVAVAVPLLPGFRPSLYTQFVGYFGTVFFGLCTAIALARLVRRGPVVTITPDGIRDTRIAAEFIPWSAIRKVSTWQYSMQRMMVLAVDPAVEKQLTLSTIARWTRSANRVLGADGLCVSAQGLKIDYDTLFKVCQDHVQARQR